MKAHPVREYRYTKDHGSFYLFAYDDNERVGAPILMADRLAVAFDPESFTLHKHGSPDGVRQWLGDVKARGPLPWPIEIAEFAPDFPVDELNRALSNSTYLRTMLAKLTKAEEQ